MNGDNEMKISTVEYNENEIEILGLVSGTAIKTKHIGHDIVETIKTLIGGELKSYGKMMEEARALATERMIEAAKELGADEIIGVRYATSNVATGASEIFVYGTAVKVLEETTEDCEDVNATKTIGSNAVKANEAL
jgi:uncharacterized protein YbjQ (UPF0145 family)